MPLIYMHYHLIAIKWQSGCQTLWEGHPSCSTLTPLCRGTATLRFQVMPLHGGVKDGGSEEIFTMGQSSL